MAFSTLSNTLNTSISKEERQDNGIFFTPQNGRQLLFSIIKKYCTEPNTILEPSFGSGEFIQDCLKEFPKGLLTGIEKHSVIYQTVSNSELFLNNKNKIRIINEDFLKVKGGTYDLILGNPPYFVTKDKDPRCMTGRGNIFVQFIYKCLTEHLKPDGILAFVLPTSFYNCSYYNPCREYIQKNNTILHVQNIDASYYETAQDTMILVIQNRPSVDNHFIFQRGKSIYITPFYKELNTLVFGADTIDSLGFRVKTGEVVWNQHKEKLSSETGIPIIYPANIVDGKIVLNNLKAGKKDEKKQYIDGYVGTPMTGPAILISRGFGNTYHFVYTSIEDPNFQFYGENHINVIYSPEKANPEVFQRIKSSLSNVKTSQFIEMFVGNGALSKTELETVLPIF
jgi:adenine-specific DNA-methyltransferase